MRIRASWFFAVAILAVLLVSNSAWEDKAPLVAGSIFAWATIFVAIAAMGRLWCSLYIAGYKQSTLVTVGPYSMCRNPLYFFSLIGAIGVGFASETLTIPLIILVAFAAYYPLVIRREQQTLLRLHGAEYAQYVATVPVFFPRVPLKEPATYVVQPIVYRRHIFSALWFVWLLGAAELIEALHESHFLPVWMSLY